jgi:flavorubredoxin
MHKAQEKKSRARKMMKVKMRRRKKASKRDYIKEIMGKHTLLVIGSPTLNPQAALPQVKKKMMKRSLPLP